jgi:hypothetical protein
MFELQLGIDSRLNNRGIEWLRDEIHGAGLKGLNLAGWIMGGCDEHHWNVRKVPLDHSASAIAVDKGHIGIKQDQVDPLFLKQIQAILAAGREADVTIPFQNVVETLDSEGVIVND